MHVFERKVKGELDGKVALSDARSLAACQGDTSGPSPRALRRFRSRAQLTGEGHRYVDRFGPQRQPRIGNEFEFRPGPDGPHPDRSPAERIKEWASRDEPRPGLKRKSSTGPAPPVLCSPRRVHRSGSHQDARLPRGL